MQYLDYQQRLKDIVQPEDISNAPTEKCLENVGIYFIEKINNIFKLNTLIAFALRVIGKGYTAGNKLFGMLDLPFLSKTAFRNQELKIQQAASIVSIESMKNAATEVKKLKNSPLESISCCGVSMDGTWQKRGYSSHNGCVSCISIVAGKVLDIEIMSHFCRICSKKAKVPDAAFNAHVGCNHMGSASSMETVGAYRICERPENHRKLQYTLITMVMGIPKRMNP
ncbi:uncharacterized protein TNCV_1922641 [Trichonephila clavipes]|nr:uncharacterized protein TNCV_1922641 [Trichonephila clavipes]